MGDGETAEGSVWEAAAFASYYNLDNLVAIVDVNRLKSLITYDIIMTSSSYSLNFSSLCFKDLVKVRLLNSSIIWRYTKLDLMVLVGIQLLLMAITSLKCAEHFIRLQSPRENLRSFLQGH